MNFTDFQQQLNENGRAEHNGRKVHAADADGRIWGVDEYGVDAFCADRAALERAFAWLTTEGLPNHPAEFSYGG